MWVIPVTAERPPLAPTCGHQEALGICISWVICSSGLSRTGFWFALLHTWSEKQVLKNCPAVIFFFLLMKLLKSFLWTEKPFCDKELKSLQHEKLVRGPHLLTIATANCEGVKREMEGSYNELSALEAPALLAVRAFIWALLQKKKKNSC